MIIHVYWCACNVPLFLQVFMKFEFSHRFSKNTQISNLMKVRPLGAELFHADGQTDMTKLIVACHSFANCPKEHSDISSHRVNVV